ncbi:MAG: type II secretion system F family protein, partial [Proteocatella sp.]
MLFESKPDIKDLNDFFKDIHRYGAANISVTESVPIFRDSVDKPILKKIMENLTRDLENGVAFPTALSKHPSFFPSFVVEMLKMGLSTGQTTALLNEIVVDLEQKIDIKREINPTLWTTKIFILLLLGLLAIAIFFVIPMLGDLLADTHAEMPLITKMVVGFCGIMQSFW